MIRAAVRLCVGPFCLAIACLATCVSLSGCGSESSTSIVVSDVTAEVGKAAPTFSGTDLNGVDRSLDDYLGEPVIVNFWASWCLPCRAEMPLLNEARNTYAVLGVNVEDSTTKAAEFVEEYDVAFPSIVDASGELAARFGAGGRAGLPRTVFIDADGVVVFIVVGELTEARLAEALTYL